MDASKCVIILDEALPLGALSNAAAILGATLGKRFPQIVGADVADGTGGVHPGIVNVPVPVLRSNAQELRALRARAAADEALFVVDFTDVAQKCRDYGEYVRRLGDASQAELDYLGIALVGEAKRVNRLTGSLPLLR